MMHALLQLAVLHRAAVEYSRQIIYNRVNDEWSSLFVSKIQAMVVSTVLNTKWRKTHVFGDEYCPPADLRTKVLNH
jgi:hypothetical protein